jgi:hypothetical protein
MSQRPVDYEQLVVSSRKNGVKKFHARDWQARSVSRAHVMVDENMAWQGSMWLMSHRWWDRVVRNLQTVGYGTLYQDSIEMLFKTWQAGGQLTLNKHAWYAHKHRRFRRTHHYRERDAAPEWKYALDTWMPEYIKQLERWGMQAHIARLRDRADKHDPHVATILSENSSIASER